ncbi:MAG: hypothetical protein GY816_09740 [Cytophagales bacterium]|nr:hypothetical protein [Cytophagales bacterium]
MKCKWVTPSENPVQLDTAIIEPSSISIRPLVSFDYDLATQTISFGSKILDSVFVCYRVLPTNLLPEIYYRDISTYDVSVFEPSNQSPNVPPDELFDFGSDIQKSGAISRGVTFGNRQSLFVNSTLNLQIQGKVSENVNIEAVITDQNIPYQPEGNTQQIRDFDNVYIRLYNEAFDLTAGDIVLTNPHEESYFLKYYKNVQGLQFKYRTRKEKLKSSTQVAGSAAKGKFASTLLTAIEGSQGPYKLRGPNGERFIIVLANSEKVFVDGKPLERGFDRDYVIDYNLGEITFNANVLVTRFTRIRVDFEYAEQFYTRTSNAVAQELSNDKWGFRFNYYSEKDNNNGTLGFQPSQTDLDVLRTIGDDLSLAQVSGVDSIAFNLGRVLYKKLDTLDQDGIVQSIFKYSTHPDSAFFAVNFTEVAFGAGDYILLNTTANGRVFQWISPQGGISQGNYQPTRQVPLPISKELITVGVDHKFSAHESIRQELAISKQDQNLYSDVDDLDNQGLAWMGVVSSSERQVGNYQLSSELKWELDQMNFNPIDRYRPIEYNRDWDYTTDSKKAKDHILWFSSGLYRDKDQQMNYQIQRRNRTDAIDGWQQRAVLNQQFGYFRLATNHFLLSNDIGDLKSDWIRTYNDLSFRKGVLVPGYQFSLDQNTLSEMDSIRSSRMHYIAHEYYLTNADSSQTQFRFSYQKRQNQTPHEGKLVDFTYTDSYQGSFGSTFGKHRVGFVGTYRKVNDQLNSLTDEWLNVRADWSGKFLKDNLSHQLTYQVGNVRELKREFIYIEVGGNQGTHAWRDENNDGVKDLNEFYEAVNPDERQYAKIFTPTDEYITAFETRYQHVIDGRFPIAWRNKGSLAGFLSKWSGQMSLNSHFKTTSEEASKRLNPFTVHTRTEEVIFAANRWRYVAYFNRARSGLGWDGSFSKTERKQLLSNGFELSERRDWNSILRWRLDQEYTIQLKNSLGRQLNTSDFLENRNVKIHSYGLGPEVIWQPLNSIRLIGGYEFRKARNQLTTDSNERSKVKEWHGNLTWNKSGKGTLSADIRLLQIDFTGVENTFVAYQLLEALSPGQNATWRFNWLQTLGSGVQMTLQYSGRTSEGSAPIHTGTVVMTAYF